MLHKESLTMQTIREILFANKRIYNTIQNSEIALNYRKSKINLEKMQ